MLAHLVDRFGEIHAGRAHKLAHDDAFRAVDDKGAVVRHQRQIAHKYFLIDDLVGNFIDQADLNSERQRERCVPVAALLFVVFGRTG